MRVVALPGTSGAGWTDGELASAVQTAIGANSRVLSRGLRLVLEHAEVALFAKNGQYHGMNELLEAVPASVLLLLDTANLFTSSEPPTPRKAEEFVRRHQGRVACVHLKSVRDGKPLDHLDGNPLAFSAVFDILAASGPQIVALELPLHDDAREVRSNMDASLAYLLTEGILDAP